MDPISLTLLATTIGEAAIGGAAAGGTAAAAAGTAGGLGAIGAGASAAGGIVGAIGNLISGGSSKAMYDYQSGIAQMNKKISLQNADYARSVGETEAQTSGMKTRFTLGKIVSGQAGGGLDVNSGSNQRVQEGEQAIGTHDEAVIRSSAAKRAYGYEVEAATDEAQSQVYKMAGKNAQTVGEIGAATSILGSASSVAGKWLDASRVGLYSGGDNSIGDFGGG